MRFLTQSILLPAALLLLAILSALLFPLLSFLGLFGAILERFARLADGALDALLRFALRLGGLGAIFGGANVLGHFDDNVARALLVAERPAHWRRAQPLPAWPFVDEAARDPQRIHIQRFAGLLRLVLGIGDGAMEHLGNFARDALFRELQNLQRFRGAMAANQVNHQPRLLRRHANEARVRHAVNRAVRNRL